MVFVIHYIKSKKSEAKSVKQSLKKNASFKSFGIELEDILTRLMALGVLEIVHREVQRKRRVNDEIILRQAGFFKTSYIRDNPNHKLFLEQYQGIYPGELFE